MGSGSGSGLGQGWRWVGVTWRRCSRASARSASRRAAASAATLAIGWLSGKVCNTVVTKQEIWHADHCYLITIGICN